VGYDRPRSPAAAPPLSYPPRSSARTTRAVGGDADEAEGIDDQSLLLGGGAADGGRQGAGEPEDDPNYIRPAGVSSDHRGYSVDYSRRHNDNR
jgi:hypothetical protein